ncbi:Swi5-domain-containing protein [Aspergillus coremiiformis]|uniref:Swi5-domain-containing protein n=1 Tax=Aspergillus coremiiformis TaxID=138285 RepID=A0A5N6Z2P8_9EURO|nr:Swi5-domain-containing protein [Aspergillus coremiiformis]
MSSNKQCTLDPRTGTDGKISEQQTVLRTSIADLETRAARMEAQLAETKTKLRSSASATVQQHISLLHEYNEIKDIGQGLMGLIADARGVRQIDVQREYGVSERD